jgi:hypothetical protein
MTDLLLDTDYDIKIATGDFVAGESTQQHQALLILSEKGEFREFPTRGVGAQSWLNDDVNFGDFNAEIKRQFEVDGMRVLSVQGKAEKLQIEAYYE